MTVPRESAGNSLRSHDGTITEGELFDHGLRASSAPIKERDFKDAAPRPRVLLVPGWANSPHNHWQSVWQRERTDCGRAELGDWNDPKPEIWIARLDAAIRRSPEPVVLVAHSLGCIAAALWAARSPRSDRLLGALLVAPCDAERDDAPACLRRFAPIPRSNFAFRTMVVASTNDPYATFDRCREFADAWGSEFVNVGAAGHINALSGLGRWTYGQTLLNSLLGYSDLSVRTPGWH